MLISFNLQHNEYVIVDSELGKIVVDHYGRDSSWWEMIAKFYSGRNLPVGRNMALAVLFYSKYHNIDAKEIVAWQNKYCSTKISNWEQIAKERDEHLEKLLVLL